MVCEVGNLFVKIDNACDYLPGFSLVNNLIDLFLKAVVLPLMSQETIDESHYFTHLNNKSIFRSLILFVPILGNMLVILGDFVDATYNDPSTMLDLVRKEPWSLKFANEDVRDNQQVVLAAVQEEGMVIEYASKRLQKNPEVLTASVCQKLKGTSREHRQAFVQMLTNALFALN